eukprot:COSAG06_NODE_2488_length_6771_cov_183.976479_4_plen_553_part_00
MVLLRPLALLLALLLPDAANPFSFSSRRRPEPRRATAGAGADASTCTTAAVCEGGTLCRPLSPQPTFTNEVVAYHADGIYGANGSEYEMYDYSKVTAIADYSWLYANETICTAHKHGVRVLGFNMIDMGALHSEQFYANESRMNAWIKTAARFTFDRGMDGIMLGQFLSSGTALSLSLSLSLSPSTHVPSYYSPLLFHAWWSADVEGAPNVTAAQFAMFGCKLRAGLHELIPGAVLTWSMSLFADKETDQAVGVGTSACAADFITLMSYESELASLGHGAGLDKFTVNLTAQSVVPLCVSKPWKCSPMYAQAQASPAALAEGIRQWNQAGVKSSQLVIATGWFAKDFACNTSSSDEHPELCAVDFLSGWTASDGGEPGYGFAIQLLAKGLAGANGLVRQWDEDFQTPYFDILGDKVATLWDLPNTPVDPKAPGLGCNRCDYIVDGQNKTRRHRICESEASALLLLLLLAAASTHQRCLIDAVPAPQTTTTRHRSVSSIPTWHLPGCGESGCGLRTPPCSRWGHSWQRKCGRLCRSSAVPHSDLIQSCIRLVF